MKTRSLVVRGAGCAWGLITALLVLGGGCGKPAKDAPSTVPVAKPAEAASQLQQAFVSAPAEVKQTATAATEALRAANYDQAMQSLQAIKARKDLTAQQAMAVHESEVAMLARLAAAMEAGDPNAKRAFERLKKSRRD